MHFGGAADLRRGGINREDKCLDAIEINAGSPMARKATCQNDGEQDTSVGAVKFFLDSVASEQKETAY